MLLAFFVALACTGRSAEPSLQPSPTPIATPAESTLDTRPEPDVRAALPGVLAPLPEGCELVSESQTIELGARRFELRASRCDVDALRYRVVVLDKGDWRPQYPDDAFAILDALHAGRADRPERDARNPFSPTFRLEYAHTSDAFRTLEGVFVDAPERVIIGEVEYVQTLSEATSRWWLAEAIDRFRTGLEDLSRAGSTAPLRDEPSDELLARLLPSITRAIEQDPALRVMTTRADGRVATTERAHTQKQFMTLRGRGGGELFVSTPPTERELGMRVRRFRDETTSASHEADLGMSTSRERLGLGELGELMRVRGADSSELSVVIGLLRCGVFVELGTSSLGQSWEQPLRDAAARVDAALVGALRCDAGEGIRPGATRGARPPAVAAARRR